jgi:hypothetical protein
MNEAAQTAVTSKGAKTAPEAIGPPVQTAPDTPLGMRGNDAAVFPYLVYKEFLAALLVSVGLMIWSLTINAPLLAEANPGRTENPAKAPWYFVGLQELLVYFDPWIAGVMMPSLIIVGLMVIPYVDTSRVATGMYTLRVRRLAISNFLFGFALWWILIAIGQFVRGPDWQFYWPWEDWSVAKSSEEEVWSFAWWLGPPVFIAYFAVGLILPRYLWPWLYKGLGRGRYITVMIFTLLLYGVPIKVLLRLLFGVKYVLVTPWFNV